MMTQVYQTRFVLQLARMSKDINHPLDANEIDDFITSMPDCSFKALLMAQNEVLSELCGSNGSEILSLLKRKYEKILKSPEFNLNQCHDDTTKPNMFERI